MPKLMQKNSFNFLGTQQPGLDFLSSSHSGPYRQGGELRVHCHCAPKWSQTLFRSFSSACLRVELNSLTYEKVNDSDINGNYDDGTDLLLLRFATTPSTRWNA